MNYQRSTIEKRNGLFKITGLRFSGKNINKATLLFALMLFGFNSYIHAQNQVANYDFNNNLRDSTSNVNDLADFGTGQKYDFIKGPLHHSSTSAIRFNGGVGLVSGKAIDNSKWKGASVSLWVRNCSDGQIYGGAYYGGSIAVDRGKMRVYFASSMSKGYVVNSSRTNLNDGKWHHVVAQTDGTMTYLYIDGQLDTTRKEIMHQLTSANSNAKMYVGTTRLDQFQLKGEVGKLVLYDDTLSAKTIEGLYKDGKLTNGRFNDYHNQTKLTMYPNPANLWLNLNQKVDKIEILDMSGRVVLEKAMDSKQLSVAELTPGIYLVRCTINNKAEWAGQLVKH
jgi:hypothetical protein